MRKYSYKADRALRSRLKRAKKYPSRKSLKNQAKIQATIQRMASGLGQFDPHEKRVIDKYYIKEEFPPKDVITEAGLGFYGNKGYVCKLLAFAGLVFIGYKYFA